MSAANVNNSSLLNALPRWINTVLVILIGYALAILTLDYVSSRLPASPTLAPEAKATVTARNSVDVIAIGKQISNAHLFGKLDAKPKAEPKKPTRQPVVETRLNLTLAGVFVYEPQDKAIAIIGTGNGAEEAFRVGDKIVGQTSLKAVYNDRVILDNNGREEVLRLPENVTPIATRRAEPARQANNASQGSSAAQQPVELPQSPGALRDTLARNPSMLGRIVSAEPYQENGKLVGYRIVPKQNPEILEAQGIIAGDVITQVNGIQLNSQKQGIRALRNAVKAQNLEVTILRDGIEIPISISLAQ